MTFCENLHFGQGQPDMEFPETAEHMFRSQRGAGSWREKSGLVEFFWNCILLAQGGSFSGTGLAGGG